MNFNDLKKGFWFWSSLIIVLLFFFSMGAIIVIRNTNLDQLGLIAGALWIITSALVPSFLGFFIYENWKPFWISIVGMIAAGFADVLLSMIFVIVNRCNHTFSGCDLSLFIPIGTMTMIFVAIATIIIIIRDWRGKETVLKEKEVQEKKLTEL